MTLRVRVLGMLDVQDWAVTGLPDDVAGQDAAVARHFAGRRVERVAAEGSHLTYVSRPAGTATSSEVVSGAEVSLVTTSGPDAGRLVPLAAPGVSLGRGDGRVQLDDPSAPSRPVTLALRASGLTIDEPTGPVGRTWDGSGSLDIGATAVALDRGPAAPLPPPRQPTPPRVELGAAPSDPSMVLPLVLAVAPLAVGAVLAATTGSALFLLFGLVSVGGAVAMLALQRRARRRHVRLLRRRAEIVAERRAREALTPSQVSRAARSGPGDRFGLTHPPASDGLLLHWGQAQGVMPLDRDGGAEAWVRAVDVGQPAVTRPGTARPTVVVGSGRPSRAAARWAVFAALRHAVATGVAMVVRTTGREEVWWQPHRATSRLLLEVPDGAGCGRLLPVWREACGTAAGDPHALATLPTVRVTFRDSADEWEGEAERVDLTARTLESPAEGLELRDLHPLGVAETTLAWWLQELGDDVARLGLTDGRTPARPLRLPARPGAESAAHHLVTPLTAPAGAGDDGGVRLDLADDGPHILLAGTTGSGKSDLMLSILTGLAAAHPPSEVSFVLLDFKGGASFGPLSGLPHTMSVETNHVGAASLRALGAIRAELHRREALFSASGVADYPSFRRSRPQEVLPRLVVAVDELRVLIDEHPDAHAVLQRLAATGRSLGFHLVLATQRASGAVSADVRSNLGTTIALRTASDQDSWDLIGMPDAARLDPQAPGSAILARTGTEPVRFRAAPWCCGDGEPVWRRWGESTQELGQATDWPQVIGELIAAWAEADPLLPSPVVTPALPEHFRPDRSRPRSAELLALLDDATRARHVPWRWPRGAPGSAAWVIEPAGGREEVLRCVLDTALRSEERLLVLDGSGEAAPALQELVRHRPAAAGSTLVLSPGGTTAEAGRQAMEAVDDLSAGGGTLVVTGWSAWAGVRVGETYRTVDEELHQRLGTPAARHVRVAAFGGRELASARLLLHLPHRFYVPAGTSAEHRLVWPRLVDVEPLPGRAVHLHPDGPETGTPAQLAFPSAPG